MLLASAENGMPSARVYGWDEPWVTLGQFQRVRGTLIAHCGVQWARRPTGGRAVLHGHDVTVGLAMPLSMLRGGTGVKQVYPHVIGIISSALQAAGAAAVLGAEVIGDRGSMPRSADCFATVSPNDIVHPRTGHKVCGCAMRLTDRAVLVQASIPTSAPLIDPRLVYADPASVSWIEVDGKRLAETLEAAINEKTQMHVASGSGPRRTTD